MSNKKAVPSEYDEQCLIFAWAKMHEKKWPELCLLNASLNGVRLTTIGQATKAKKSGMKRGFPDIFLPVFKGGYSGLFIELKKTKGGSISKDQKWWIDALNNQKYKAVVCRGANEAINTIVDYLKVN